MSLAILRRLTLLPLRLLAVWLLVALVVELAAMGPRGRGEAAGGQTLTLARELMTGAARIDAAAAGRSLSVSCLAVMLCLAFGPVLGVVVARFRRHAWVEALLSPWLAAAWLPGFWIVTLAVWWQVTRWGLPGYADAAPAQGGPVRWEPLWRAMVIAMPVAFTGIGWQTREISSRLKRSARALHVRGAHSRGVFGSALFYRHVFRPALEPLLRSPDRSLPAMLGMQLLAEWATRYPGMGTLAVESARQSQLGGLLVSGLFFSTLLVCARWLGETLTARLNGVPRILG